MPDLVGPVGCIFISTVYVLGLKMNAKSKFRAPLGCTIVSLLVYGCRLRGVLKCMTQQEGN